MPIQEFSLQEEDNTAEEVMPPLSEMTTDQLLEWHAKIEARLPGLALTEVNLVKETLLQVHRAKALQELAATEKGTPMNQRAQVQNSLANMIANLAKVQSSLYSSERIKRIQSAVIKVVKTLPKPQQDQFFDMLAQELDAAASETDSVEVV